MQKWADKMFDSFLNWLENVQWNRDKRRIARELKKEKEANACVKKSKSNNY